jgi:hypothetical protein
MLADRTADAYARNVGRWLSWLDARALGLPTPADVLTYVADLRADGLKPASVNAHLDAVRGLYRWAETCNAYPSIARSVRGLAVRKDEPLDCLDREAVAGLLAYADGERLDALRDRALVHTLFSTGLRLVSLCALNVGSLDAGDCVLTYAGKGDRDAGRRADWHKYFKDKDRARRSLERDHGDVTARIDGRDPALLERLIGLKSDQYRRSRLHDIFACGWTADLLRALLTDTRVEGFGARLAVLEAGGEPVAFEYGLHAGANYHFWLPAYEASVSRYSPGILLSLDTMRLGSAEGFRVFDYGFEGEPYKKYFCNRSQTVLEGVAHRQGYAGAMAAAFSMAGADAALAAGERFVSAGLGLSVRRRWASIDACETTVVGRARGIAAAASAALNKTRPRSAVSVPGAKLFL